MISDAFVTFPAAVSCGHWPDACDTGDTETMDEDGERLAFPGPENDDKQPAASTTQKKRRSPPQM
jgi:hypothetical protein